MNNKKEIPRYRTISVPLKPLRELLASCFSHAYAKTDSHRAEASKKDGQFRLSQNIITGTWIRVHPPVVVEFGMVSKNFALAVWSVENRPKTATVAVLLPNFSIPLETIQVW